MIWASIFHLKCEKVVKFIVFITFVRELPPPPLVILIGQLIVCTAHSHRHSQYDDKKEGRKHSTKCTTDFQTVQACIDIIHHEEDHAERQKAPKEHVSRCLHVPSLITNLTLKVYGGTSYFRFS